jgi:hypothetical protein
LKPGATTPYYTAPTEAKPPHIGYKTMLGNDGQPWVHEIRTSFDPKTGEAKTVATPIRPAAPTAGGVAGQDRTTTETGVKVIPGKEITDTVQLGKFREALPLIVNRIAGSSKIKGWMKEGPFVEVEGHADPVRREDVIKRAFKRDLDIDVEVRWDGKQWVLVRARIPTKREVLEKTRRTGPTRPASGADDEEE